MSITLQVVTPVSATNLIKNPSAESDTNYTAVTCPVTRSTTYARLTGYNASYSFRCQTNNGGQGVSYTTATLTNTTHTASVWVTGTCPGGISFIIGSTTVAGSVAETVTVGGVTWTRYSAAFTGAQVSGQSAMQALQALAGTGDFYLDDAQLEATSYLTTAFNGAFNGSRGFRWNGIAHQSTSTMHPRLPDGSPNLAGGRVYTLNSDRILVSSALGLGVPPIDIVSQTGVEEGGIYQSQTVSPRSITLEVTVTSATGQPGLHTQRDTLMDYIRLGEPFVLRYTSGTAAAFPFEFVCVYAGGLEGRVELPMYEKFTLQLLALDPRARAPLETSVSLATGGTITLAYAATKQQGVWTSPGSMPASNCRCVAVSPSGHTYVGAYVSAGAGIVRGWDGATWGTATTTTGGNGWVYAAAFDPAGAYLYLGGDFTQAGGVANTAYIARYQLPASGVTGGTVTALGTGLNGAVRALAVDATGALYAFGDFTTAGGASANYAAKWNGSAWAALGANTAGTSSTTSTNGAIHCAQVDSAGNVYVGGDFATLGAGISAPTPTSALVAVSGAGQPGGGAAMTYKLVYRTGDGRTLAGSASVSRIPSAGQGVALSWTTTPAGGVDAIEIYRASAGGTSYYLTSVPASSTSYTDDNSVTVSALAEPTTATDGARSARVAKWDATWSGWRSVGAYGMADGIVRSLALLGDDASLVAVGSFTRADGGVATRAAYYNGQTWSAMGDGLTGGFFGPYGAFYNKENGRVYALGDFGFDLCEDIAMWTPGTGGAGYWAHTDLSAPSNTVFLAGTVDHNGDVWIVGDSSSAASVGAATTVTVTQAPGFYSYPRIYVTGPGTLRSIENWTTGQRLRFNMAVAANEVVTLDFRPHRKSITSTRNGGSRRMNGLVDGPFGSFGLVGGANVITVLMTGVTAASSVRLVDPEARLSADVQ